MNIFRRELKIRPMMRRDRPAVRAIERESFFAPWSEEKFIETATDIDNHTEVAEVAGQIVGFSVFRERKSQFTILSMAVRPDRKREGVGSMLIKSMLHRQKDKLVVRVHERGLDSQLFFRAMGFKTARIDRRYFDGSDGYVLVRNKDAEMASVTSHREDIR